MATGGYANSGESKASPENGTDGCDLSQVEDGRETLSTSRRRSRRSWFETPPPKKFEMAVESFRLPAKRRSLDTEEILLLTHFTNPPKLSFGKTKLGKTKSRVLVIKNPHDYDQEVHVEKFPFKKNFTIEETLFVVKAESDSPIVINWTPDTAGNFREMILFKIDGVYRLQAFLLGCCDAPKQPAKKRKGLLGSKVKYPLSILQTQSLSRIRSDYSQEQPRSPIPMKTLPQKYRQDLQAQEWEDESPGGFFPPTHESTAIAGVDRPQGFKTSAPPLTDFSPIPHVEAVQGHARDFVDANNCVLQMSAPAGGSSIMAAPLARISETRILAGALRDETSERSALELAASRPCREVLTETRVLPTPVAAGLQQCAPPVPLNPERKALSPDSFLNNSVRGAQGWGQNNVCDEAMTPPSPFDDSPPAPLHTPSLSVVVSPNSFLEESMREREEAAMIRLGEDGVPSPSSLLNTSIPHGIVVEQLRSVKVSLLKDTSLQRTPAQTVPGVGGRPVAMNKECEEEEERMKTAEEINQDWISSLRSSGRKVTAFGRSMGNRRQRFVPSPQSTTPRRTTFNVRKGDTQSRLVAGQQGPVASTRTPSKCDQPGRRMGKSSVTNQSGSTPSRQTGSDARGDPKAKRSQEHRLHTKRGPSELVLERRRSPPLVTSSRVPSATVTKARPKMKNSPEAEKRGQDTRRKISPDTVIKKKPDVMTKPHGERPAQSLAGSTLTALSDNVNLEMMSRKREAEVADDAVMMAASLPEQGLTDSAKVTCDDDDEQEEDLSSSTSTVVKVKIKEGSGHQVASATVTKDPRPACSSTDSQNRSGRRLFPQVHSPESRETEMEAGVSPLQFGTPSNLPTSPSQLSTRRNTMTVTKSRPSDALLTATKTALQKQLYASEDDVSYRLTAKEIFEEGEVVSTEVTTSLQEVRVTKIATPTKRGRPGIIITTVEEKLQVLETKRDNELVEKSEDAQVALSSVPKGAASSCNITPSFEGTPQNLPTSPLSENTRRSTRVIANPRVIDPSTCAPRRLFPPLGDHDDASKKGDTFELESSTVAAAEVTSGVPKTGDTFELESSTVAVEDVGMDAPKSRDTFELETSTVAVEYVGMTAERMESLKRESSEKIEVLVRECEQEYQLQVGRDKWKRAKLEAESFPILMEQTGELRQDTAASEMATAVAQLSEENSTAVGQSDGQNLPEAPQAEKMQKEILTTSSEPESEDDMVEINEGRVFYRISSPTQRAPVRQVQEVVDLEDTLVQHQEHFGTAMSKESTVKPELDLTGEDEVDFQITSASQSKPALERAAKTSDFCSLPETREIPEPTSEATETESEDFVDCESRSNADSEATDDLYMSTLLDQSSEADLYLSFEAELLFVDHMEFKVERTPRATITVQASRVSQTAREGTVDQDNVVTPAGDSTSHYPASPVAGFTSPTLGEDLERTPISHRVKEKLMGSFITLEGPSSVKKRSKSSSSTCNASSRSKANAGSIPSASDELEMSASVERNIDVLSQSPAKVSAASVEEHISQAVVSAQSHLQAEQGVECGSAKSPEAALSAEDAESAQAFFLLSQAQKALSEESGEGDVDGRMSADSEDSDVPVHRVKKSLFRCGPRRPFHQAGEPAVESSDSEREAQIRRRMSRDSLNPPSSSMESDSLEAEHSSQSPDEERGVFESSDQAEESDIGRRGSAARVCKKSGALSDTASPAALQQGAATSSSSGAESEPVFQKVQVITTVTSCPIQPDRSASVHLSTVSLQSCIHSQSSPGLHSMEEKESGDHSYKPTSFGRPLRESQSINRLSLDEPDHSIPLQRSKWHSADYVGDSEKAEKVPHTKYLSEVSLNRLQDGLPQETLDFPPKTAGQTSVEGPGKALKTQRELDAVQGRVGTTFLKKGSSARKATIAKETPKTRPGKTESSSKENKRPGSMRKPAKGVPQSKLLLLKKSGLPKHPMPFASKNMYYDERWQEKQERGFTHWLNFMLTPPEEYNHPGTRTKVDAGSLGVDCGRTVRLAPTKEVLSVRAYTERRRLNRLRRAACLLYQSEPVVAVIRKVEVEVESRRLAVRKDKMLHADIGIKQQILDLLLSYNPLWLRIGLEVVFGELLMLQSNTDVIGMSRFILYRLLGNPDIAQAFAHPTVPHLYREGYADALSQHTLKKFLLLVFFLDRAKSSRLIDYDPCLFCKDSDIKASKTLLVQFSRDYLRGEGDITRHLAYLGYQVSVVQTSLDEFDYAVTNLRVDLRDGLRLMRVLEFLTEQRDLVRTLRTPAISRLQKVHNMEAVFRLLASRDLDLSSAEEGGISPRAVVDGNRDKTLALLWRLIFHFQVEVMLNEEQLKEEIAILEKSLKVKVSMQELLRLQQPVQARRDSGEATLLAQNERLALLLKWCRVVCLHYGVRVENFTVSFSDGRALCCLVHHYHPALLPLAAVQWQTSQSYQEELEQQGQERLNSSTDWSPLVCSAGEDDQALFESLRANERENFKLLFEKVSALGGVPMMVKFADMSGTIPDERVVAVYLGYLCGRLLDVHQESRAARILQLAWRRRKLRHAQALQLRQEKAARVIQAAVRKFLARQRQKVMTQAAKVIQACWRGHSARVKVHDLRQAKDKAAQISAATCIQRQARTFLAQCRSKHVQRATLTLQAAWRSFAARQEFLRRRHAATRLQAFYRGWHTRQSFQATRQAALTIQHCYRALVTAREARRDFLSARKAAVVLQSWLRGTRQRRQYMALKESAAAATRIQSWYRSHRERQRFLKQRRERAAVVIQSSFRSFQQRQKLKRQQMEEAAVVLQSCFRGYHQRKCLAAEREAATRVQATFRCHRYRTKFLAMRLAASIIQRAYRLHRQQVQSRREQQAAQCIARALHTWHSRCSFLRQRQAAVCIQRRVRAWILGREQRRDFYVTLGAAITLQAWWRGLVLRRSYCRIRVAVVTLQSLARGFLVRRQLQERNQAAVILQRFHRCRLLTRVCRQKFLAMRQAAVTLQAHVRGRTCRQQFLQRRQGAVRVQAAWRGLQARRRFEQQRRAVLVLQQRYRAQQAMSACRRQFLVQKGAAMTLQAWWRGVRLRCQLTELHRSATLIQATFRGHLTRQRLHQQCAAATVIQSKFRCYKARQNFLAMQRAAVVMQSLLRCHRARREFQAIRKAAKVMQSRWRSRVLQKAAADQLRHAKCAAVTIQKNFRAFQARKAHLALKWAACAVQRQYRLYRARHSFLKLRQAAIVLQRMWRARRLGKLTATEYQQMRSSAIAIQSCLRMHQARKEFLALRKAVILAQSCFRSRRERENFKASRRAAVVIQQRWRARQLGKSVAAEYLRVRSAALSVQANFRRLRARAEFIATRQAALTMQRRYRATTQARVASREFQHAKHAVTRIQAVFRGNVARRNYRAQVQAVVRMQAAVRGYLDRQRYLKLRTACITIQRRWRARKQMQIVQREMERQQQAAVLLQSCYKGWRERRHFLTMKRATITFQKNFRRLQSKRHYQTYQNAAQVIQKFYRAHRLQQRDRKSFLLQRQSAALIQRAWRLHREQRQAQMSASATKVQACFRGWLAHRRYATQRRRVILLQSWVRAYLCRCRLSRQRCSAQLIQAWWRGMALTRRLRLQFLMQVGATIVIQTAFRRHRQRQLFCQLQKSAVTLQAAVRGWQQRQRFLALRKAVTTVQACFRARSAMVTQRQQFLQLKSAARIIQAAFQGHQVRRQLRRNQAAVQLQSWFRMMQQRRQFLQALEASRVLAWQNRAAAVIQSTFRMYQQQKAYLQAREDMRRQTERVQAATVIQSYFRMCRERKAYVKHHQAAQLLAQQHQAAVTIQSYVRMHRERKAFLQHQRKIKCIKAAVKIQSLLRMVRQRRAYLSHLQSQRELARRTQAAIVLQSCTRMYLQKQAYVRLQESIKMERLKQASAVILQKNVRAMLQRRRFRSLQGAAVKIQAAVRGLQARRRLQKMLEAICCIQRNVRTFLVFRRMREEVQKREKAARVIQKAYRLHHLQAELARVKAVVRLQAMVRVYLARVKYQRARQALVCVQSLARGLLTRRRMQEARRRDQAALIIQTAYRIYQARQLQKGMEEQRRVFLTSYATMMLYHKSALQIRLWNRRSVALLRAQKQIHCIIFIQRRVQVFLARRRFLQMRAAALVLQRAVRRWLCRRREAACTLQRTVRQWLPKARELRRQKSATRIQALWRGWRLRRAEKNKKIVRARERIKEAARTATEEQKLGNRTASALDFLLRYKQLSHILEALMHLEVATRLSSACCSRLLEVNAVSVIFRLIRSCNRSVPHMQLIQYSIDILLNLVKYDKTQHAVGGEEESLATLVELMAVYREKPVIFTRVCLLVGILALDPQYRQSILSDEKLVERLRSLELLTRRKHQKEAERQARQAKMAALRSFAGASPTQARTRRRIRPAWLLQPDSLHELPDPLSAIRFVLDNLGLASK